MAVGVIRARTRDCLVHIPGVIPGELTTGPAGLSVFGVYGQSIAIVSGGSLVPLVFALSAATDSGLRFLYESKNRQLG